MTKNIMINNEKEDKRKLIDEVGGILKGKVDDEIIKTIMKRWKKLLTKILKNPQITKKKKKKFHIEKIIVSCTIIFIRY